MTKSDRAARVERLAASAALRSADAESRARRAIMKLENADEPISFVAVARSGRVSTSFLYQHRDLRQQILDRRRSGASPRRPDAESASAASVRVKLQVVLQRNRELAEELALLRTENEVLRSRVLELGHQHRSSPTA